VEVTRRARGKARSDHLGELMQGRIVSDDADRAEQRD
jgi:hypothetical protein